MPRKWGVSLGQKWVITFLGMDKCLRYRNIDGRIYTTSKEGYPALKWSGWSRGIEAVVF
jgi:hypothetical protein